MSLACFAVVLIAVRPKARIQRVQCAHQLRSIGQCLQLYANDNNGLLPPDLAVLIPTLDLSPEVLICPSSSDTPAKGLTTQTTGQNTVTLIGHCSYVYLGAGLNVKSLTPDHVLAYEILKNHENDGMNVLYGDGHVQWLPKPEALHLLAELKVGHNPPRPQAPTSQP
ncbi:MAG: H-X9-DG-CTERM domain-containing protein [Tepidisphaeraceae bacterium]